MVKLTVDEIIKKFSPEDIKQAAKKIEVEEKIRSILKDTRWKDCQVIQDTTTFLLPALHLERRPLAVSLHSYGLWIEPIYTSYKGSGKPEYDFALHIDETDDGLHIYVEDEISMILSGTHDSGFKLEIIETDKKTKIIDNTPKYR